jgi:hypothetical protein
MKYWVMMVVQLNPTFSFSSATTTGMFKLSGESGLGFTCGNSENYV